jgi:hypothetical protein
MVLVKLEKNGLGDSPKNDTPHVHFGCSACEDDLAGREKTVQVRAREIFNIKKLPARESK